MKKEQRIFVLVNRTCLGATGGGRGVAYKMYLANNKYHLITNKIYYVFSDVVIDPSKQEGIFKPVFQSPEAQLKLDSWLGKCRRLIIWVKNNIVKKNLIQEYNLTLKRIGQYYDKLDKRYHFREDDLYICHDVESAYVLIKKYGFTNISVVYHQQGSLYNEFNSFTGITDEKYHKYLNSLLSKVAQGVKILSFPSYGAQESLVESEPQLKKVIKGIRSKIAYNGFDKPDELQVPSDSIITTLNKLKATEDLKFVSVAVLNLAKGVERIPEYLSQIKNNHPRLKWVIVGDGIRGEELLINIQKFGLQNNVIWIKNKISHDDILNIFANTDIYILAHRFSIFDYATIEAMSYGNIPVLTKVGGNKEVVLDSNGIFIEDFRTDNGLDNLINKFGLKKLKEKNIRLQNEKFSELAFLQGYFELLELLTSQEDNIGE